ncbi:MAG TPA: hypothetical protein VFI33_13670 [Puia sp.]|nr:hypothetical protein [Puia sp.]
MRTLFLLLILCKSAISFAQSTKPVYKVVPIVTSHSFYLKGGSRALVGNSSRQVLPIQLPANTVEWYYTITTTNNRKQSLNSDLTAQLDKLLEPELGITSDALSTISVPGGSGLCDVYVMTNPNEVVKYVNKQPAASFLMNDSRQKYVSGIIQVKDFLYGSCFLVLRNPSASQGLNITVEVTAIVLASATGSSTAMQ